MGARGRSVRRRDFGVAHAWRCVAVQCSPCWERCAGLPWFLRPFSRRLSALLVMQMLAAQLWSRGLQLRTCATPPSQQTPLLKKRCITGVIRVAHVVSKERKEKDKNWITPRGHRHPIIQRTNLFSFEKGSQQLQWVLPSQTIPQTICTAITKSLILKIKL